MQYAYNFNLFKGRITMKGKSTKNSMISFPKRNQQLIKYSQSMGLPVCLNYDLHIFRLEDLLVCNWTNLKNDHCEKILIPFQVLPCCTSLFNFISDGK